MSDPRPTDPRVPLPTRDAPRRLDHAPGERYAPRGGPAGSPGGGLSGGGPGSRGGGAGSPGGGALADRRSAVVAAVIVADAGAVVFLVLGQLGIGAGLIAWAGFSGWLTALALGWRGRAAIPDARARAGFAVGLAAWSVVGGLLADWVFSNVVQQGVLGPLDYIGQVYGPVAPLALLAAVALAAMRAR